TKPALIFVLNRAAVNMIVCNRAGFRDRNFKFLAHLARYRHRAPALWGWFVLEQPGVGSETVGFIPARFAAADLELFADASGRSHRTAPQRYLPDTTARLLARARTLDRSDWSRH